MTEEAQDRQGRLSALETEPFRPDSLVGSYFHAGDRATGAIEKQGAVVADVAPGYVLVETFNWGAGGSHSQEVVAISDMASSGWRFYDSNDWMVEAHDEHTAKQQIDRRRA